jgi:hypothetical protein
LVSALLHGIGVPLAFIAIASFAAPAFYIALWHCGAEIDASCLAAATASGLYDAGRALAGLSPAALLFALTAETPFAVAVFSGCGLGLALMLGFRTLLGRLSSGLTQTSWGVAAWPFCAFSSVLAARVWWSVLPALGGAS